MPTLFQFSIRGLLIGVTILSVGIAALLNAGPWWEAAVWAATLFFLAIAVLLVVHRCREQRAFWLGFSVLGWLYLAVLAYSWIPSANPQYIRSDPLAQSSLITTRLSNLTYHFVLPDSRKQQTIVVSAASGDSFWTVNSNGRPAATFTVPVGQRAPQVSTLDFDIKANGFSGPISLAFTPAGTLTTANPQYVPIENFIHIAHALWLLLIAAIGGKVCQLIDRTRPKEKSAAPTVVS